MRRLLFAFLVALCALLVPERASGGARRVIEPGQEALVGRMLGGELPAGCRLLGAAIEKERIDARYGCGATEGRISIVHPDGAPDALARSARLALVAREGPRLPAALIETLGDRLRAHDATWRWTEEGRALGRSFEEAGLDPRARRFVGPAAAAAALAFAAMFAAAVALSRRGFAHRPGGDAPVAGPKDTRRDLVAALLVAFAAFLFLLATSGSAPAHADTTRDLLMAADCLAGHACDHGPPTSLGVVVQGALWTRWLAATGALGLAAGSVHAAVLALHGLAAAVILLATRRDRGLGVAVLAAAFYATVGARLVAVPILWNPSLSPLPLALFHACLVALAGARHGDRASIAWAAGAGGALALTIDCHVLFAVLVPVLLATTVGCARRPVGATLAAITALAATLLVDSRTAWLVNARAVAGAGATLAVVGVAAVALAVGAALRKHLAALSSEGRSLASVGAGAAFAGGAALAIFAGFAAESGPRYLMPAAPGLALGVAYGVAWVARRAARAPETQARIFAVLGALVALGPSFGRASDAAGLWTLGEAEKMGSAAYRSARSYRELLARARARTPAIIPALALAEPRGAPTSASPGDDLLLFSVARGSAPAPLPGLELVDLGQRVGVIAKVRPFLDWTRVRFCFGPVDGDPHAIGCVDTGLDRDTGPLVTPEQRAYPALEAVRDAFPDGALRRLGRLRETITIAVEARAGAAHRVTVVGPASEYRIAKVTGLAFDGRLPAKAVVLAGVDASGAIDLVREDDATGSTASRTWPPAVIEVPDDDPVLARLVDDPDVH